MIELSDKVMIKDKINLILKALLSKVSTLQEIKFRGVNWNADENRLALVNLVASASQLRKCDITNQSGDLIELVFEKGEDDQKNLIKVQATENSGNQVFCQAETNRTERLVIINQTE